ncbi:ATP-dependent Clp protease proteolytic subunit [Candidatus Aerophobetes bacterium]|nr:ATP-dependent Clp protease proteolytic subunit [Candidatus Aerophobetes bacterium]
MKKKLRVIFWCVGFIIIFALSSQAEMPKIRGEDWVSISGEITPEKAEEVITSLITLDSKPVTSPIGIRISSSGGSLMSVMAICDTIKALRRPVVTVGLGETLSGGAIILSSGDRRFLGEHTMVMLHQPTVVIQNWSFSVEELQQLSFTLDKIEDQMYSLLAKNTGKTVEQLKELLKEEKWFTAKEAIEFGIADELLGEGGFGEQVEKEPPSSEVENPPVSPIKNSSLGS